MPYLEFNELDEYLSYLRARDCDTTHIILSIVLGKPSEHNIKTVVFYTALTQKINDSIICCAIPSGSTNNFALEQDKRLAEEAQFLPKVKKYFAEIKEEVESKGWKVESGKWTFDTPGYLLTEA